MPGELLRWTDRAGVIHHLQQTHEIAMRDYEEINSLCQQFQYSNLVLAAGYQAPAIEQARPHIMRRLLRILLPNVSSEEIAAFDIADGTDLLARWRPA